MANPSPSALGRISQQTGKRDPRPLSPESFVFEANQQMKVTGPKQQESKSHRVINAIDKKLNYYEQVKANHLIENRGDELLGMEISSPSAMKHHEDMVSMLTTPDAIATQVSSRGSTPRSKSRSSSPDKSQRKSKEKGNESSKEKGNETSKEKGNESRGSSPRSKSRSSSPAKSQRKSSVASTAPTAVSKASSKSKGATGSAASPRSRQRSKSSSRSPSKRSSRLIRQRSKSSSRSPSKRSSRGPDQSNARSRSPSKKRLQPSPSFPTSPKSMPRLPPQAPSVAKIPITDATSNTPKQTQSPKNKKKTNVKNLASKFSSQDTPKHVASGESGQNARLALAKDSNDSAAPQHESQKEARSSTENTSKKEDNREPVKVLAEGRLKKQPRVSHHGARHSVVFAENKQEIASSLEEGKLKKQPQLSQHVARQSVVVAENNQESASSLVAGYKDTVFRPSQGQGDVEVVASPEYQPDSFVVSATAMAEHARRSKQKLEEARALVEKLGYADERQDSSLREEYNGHAESRDPPNGEYRRFGEDEQEDPSEQVITRTPTVEEAIAFFSRTSSPSEQLPARGRQMSPQQEDDEVTERNAAVDDDVYMKSMDLVNRTKQNSADNDDTQRSQTPEPEMVDARCSDACVIL